MLWPVFVIKKIQFLSIWNIKLYKTVNTTLHTKVSGTPLKSAKVEFCTTTWVGSYIWYVIPWSSLLHRSTTKQTSNITWEICMLELGTLDHYNWQCIFKVPGRSLCSDGVFKGELESKAISTVPPGGIWERKTSHADSFNSSWKKTQFITFLSQGNSKLSPISL